MDKTETEKFLEEDDEITGNGQEAREPDIEWLEFEDNDDAVAHIFSKPHIKKELVAVQEWRMMIEVRGLPAGIRNALIQKHMSKDGTPNIVQMYPDLVIASCYNPKNGKKFFKPQHRDTLNLDGGDIIDRLAMVASRLSGLDKDAQERARKN